MKWKLKPKETISYKAYIKDDTSGSRKDQFREMFKDFGDSTGKASDAMQKMMEQMRELTPEYYNALLTETKTDVVDIELIAKTRGKKNDVSAENGMGQLMNAMASGPMFRGAVHEDGSIKSFYLKNEQKNILAIFFQLPAKPVKVGDEWKIDTHLISMDQNFKCDSSYNKNVVKVSKIDNSAGDKMVTVTYEILEYARGDFSIPFAPSAMGSKNDKKTLYKVAYKAVGVFSIQKGRWLSYEGEMETTTTGLIDSQSKQRYALVP